MKSTFANVFAAILTFVFLFIITRPVLNYGYYGLPFISLLSVGVYLMLQIIKLRREYSEKNPVIAITIAVILGCYLILVPVITSWPLFHHQKYRALIGEVKTGESYSNHIEAISVEQIRIVDKPLAHLLGEKVLGAQPALGSQVHLGEFTIQQVNDQLYWIAPLEHSGFFKWINNMHGTPGYVMVSATNERDVRLVQSVNGKFIKIKYQPGSFFLQNTERYLYYHGYATRGLVDYSFEIDDAGQPFWVVTVFKNKIGFHGSDAVGVLVVDAQNGKITEYNSDNIPLWIDRFQPSDFIHEQLDDWGEYVNGYWNFSNQNKLQTTEKLSLVYGEKGKSYWYTGLTSVGSDESTVGFVLVDTRTKEATWYKQSGATEFAAQKSAMGKVQEKGYTASLPIPYNINGIPTYVMTLKDNGGLIKMFAMVCIEDYTILGVGNSLKEAMIAYKNAFNSQGNRINPEASEKKVILKSVIERISSDIRNGNSYYYFTIKENREKIFVGSSLNSNEIPISQTGDSIEITYDDDKDQIIDIVAFKNLSYPTKVKMK